MNFLRDVCEIADLMDVVIGCIDIMKLSMEFIVWYERYRGLTPTQWKEIYEKRYHDLTFEFVVTYQDKFSEFKPAPMTDIVWSFTICIENFHMLQEKHRIRWIGHCLMHPGVKLQDIHCSYTSTIYGLLTSEDKYWLYQKFGDGIIARVDRSTMELIREQKLLYTREMDYIRMVKDDELDFRKLLDRYDDGSFIYVTVMAPLILKKYCIEFDKYPGHLLIYQLKRDYLWLSL
jgi:hypothetical protein